MDMKLVSVLVIISVLANVYQPALSMNGKNEPPSPGRKTWSPTSVVRFATGSKECICSGAVVGACPRAVVLTTKTCGMKIKGKGRVIAKGPVDIYQVRADAQFVPAGDHLVLLELYGDPQVSFMLPRDNDTGPYELAMASKWISEGLNDMAMYVETIAEISVILNQSQNPFISVTDPRGYSDCDSGSALYFRMEYLSYDVVGVRNSASSYINVAMFKEEIRYGIDAINSRRP